MEKQEADNILKALRKRIPARMQYPYLLCKNEYELFSMAATIFNIPIMEYMNSYIFVKDKNKQKLFDRGYYRSRRLLRCYLSNDSYQKNGFYGLLIYNAILINYGIHDLKTDLQFTYLHEVGHRLGRNFHYKGYNEYMADRIALAHKKYIE